MQPRKKVTFGRPSGTDGSDFSYRMVVDPRYTKVAQAKSRLKTLIIIQAVMQLIGILISFSKSKEEAPVLSMAIGIVSILIGEIGRKRSQANMLRLYIIASSVVTVLSLLCVVRSNILLEAFQGSIDWFAQKLELVKLGAVLLGIPVEIFAITTTVLLVQNMTVPKRAS